MDRPSHGSAPGGGIASATGVFRGDKVAIAIRERAP